VNQTRSEAAGDATAPTALLKQATQLVANTSQIATTHKTVAVAAHLGSSQANSSVLDKEKAPVSAQHRAASGMLDTKFDAALSDAGNKSTTADANNGSAKIPHSTDPLMTFAAKGGLGVVAGQDLQFANGEAITLASGQDSNFALADQLRIHTGQALGVLAGAQGQGSLKVIAAQGPVLVQAQADTMTLASKAQLKMVSVSGDITLAASKRFHAAVKGGASITMENGNMVVQCPGTLTVHAGQKSFVGGAKVSSVLPQFPRSAIENVPVKFDLQLQDVPGPNGASLPETQWRIVSAPDQHSAVLSKKELVSGTSDVTGKVVLSPAQETQLLATYNESPSTLWIVAESHAHNVALKQSHDDWTDQHKQHQALDAMGYSDDLATVGDEPVDDFFTRQAYDETKARTGAALINKTKKG
ncbi:MAG: type secretion system tip protein VgrG, partial [Rhodocyclales bacterium]|nr:type secretion system tip protein VgrG [Rhodocyclales bacterium]